MNEHIGPAQSPAGGQFAAYEDELRAAEKKVSGEIDPGARALMVAVGVLVAMVSLVLPHTGAASGLEVLANAPDAAHAHLNVTSRIFVYMLLIFAVGGSAVALLTRRWVVAWVALCGTAVTCVAGILAWWSRHTPGVGGVEPPSGVGVGLVLGEIAALLLAFHWARIVWARSTYHLALEEERRRAAAERDELARLLQTRPHPGGTAAGDIGNDPDDQD